MASIPIFQPRSFRQRLFWCHSSICFQTGSCKVFAVKHDVPERIGRALARPTEHRHLNPVVLHVGARRQ